MFKRPHIIIIAIMALVILTACGWRQKDRCWISSDQYAIARELYLSTSSMEIVKQTLKDDEWTPGEINESSYRLIKEFKLETAGTAD